MRIMSLRLRTNTLAALRVFYAETLGLPLVDQSAHHFEVRAGASRLSFETQASGSPTYHFAFNITDGLLPSAKAWLSDRAALLSADGADEFPSDRLGSRQIYFCDPAGNILEFMVDRTIPDVARPFSAADIVNISEIGLPTIDMASTIERLGEIFGVSPFNGMSPSFAPLGDFEGRFIVVPAARHWFPTELPSGLYPLDAIIAGEADRQCELPALPYDLRTRQTLNSMVKMAD